VICCNPGTYSGNLSTVPKEVTIVGLQGPYLTTILGDGTDSVIHLNADSGQPVTLHGFTITGGIDNGSGGGIIMAAASPTLRWLVITGNQAGSGGGMRTLAGAVPTLEHVEISGNTAINSGGGLQTADFAGFMEDVLIEGNSAGTYGGGISMSGDNYYENVVVVGNDAVYQGGGIYVGSHSMTLVNAVVSDNEVTSYGGGGIKVESGNGATLDNVRIENNLAETYGGGLWASDAIVYLNNVAFVGNEVLGGGGGGAIAVSGNALAMMENGLVVGNSAATEGGGVLVNSPTAGFIGRNTILYGNIAVTEGGGIAVNSMGVGQFDYCDVFGNIPDDYHGMADQTGLYGNISEDPRLLWVAPLDPLLWDLHLDVGSDLIDTGDPTIFDPDLSVSDMGIYGGAGADEFDLDQDSYYDWFHSGPYNPAVDVPLGKDCDDRSPYVYPGNGC